MSLERLLKNILLFGHGGSGNHGCEAIVRSTIKILKESISKTDPILISKKIEQEKEYGVDKLCAIEDVGWRPKNWDYYRSYLNMKLFGKYEDFDTYPLRQIINNYKASTIALSVGGDNYCYGNNRVLAYQNSLFNDAGIKTILWGCSIEEPVLNNLEGKKDLMRYSYILARESLTYDALLAHGFKNVALYPDPAFTLSKKDINVSSTNMVGINLSPWIMKCEGKRGAAFQNYTRLIDYILNQTSMRVILIPHVVWNHNDDRVPLKELYNQFSHTNRIVLVEDNDAEYLKGVISKCRFMIAARTHASIAAYSTCVPTLVVGYSIKAKGIAKDIFGAYDNYVLPVQQLGQPDDLTNSFRWLMGNEDRIRQHLQVFMPGYIEKAWEAGAFLNSLQ